MIITLKTRRFDVFNPIHLLFLNLWQFQKQIGLLFLLSRHGTLRCTHPCARRRSCTTEDFACCHGDVLDGGMHTWLYTDGERPLRRRCLNKALVWSTYLYDDSKVKPHSHPVSFRQPLSHFLLATSNQPNQPPYPATDQTSPPKVLTEAALNYS